MASQKEQVELFIRVLGREQLQLAAQDVARLSQGLAAISSQVANVSGRLRTAVAAMQAGLAPLQRFDKAFASALSAPSLANLRNLKRTAEEAFSVFQTEQFADFGKAAEEGIKRLLDATIDARAQVRSLAQEIPPELLQTVQRDKKIEAAPGALPLPIQSLVRSMQQLGSISPTSVMRVVEALRELGAEDLAKEWEDAFVTLQTAVGTGMNEARQALLGLQPVASSLSSQITGIVSGLPKEMQQPLTVVSRELDRLNRELLKGSVTVGSFDRAISAANTALELLGRGTVRETEAVAQLRAGLASVRDELLNYRNAIAAANQEMQAQEQLARRHVARTPEEGRRIKILQSVLQGLIIGYSALQGQLLFTAFSLIFVEHAIIRLALGTAALVIAIEGVRKAFMGMARAAVGAASQLDDLRLQFQALTRDAGQAQAAMSLASDIAVRFGFAIGDVAQGLLELRREGLLTAETVKAVGNLAAATGTSYAEAAKLFTQAVGRQVGSMEALFDVGIRIPGMFEKTEEAQRGVLNEMGRLQRMQVAARAINEQFAGAMERRMNTLTGAWQALRSAVQQAFAIIGQPIIQDLLLPALRGLLRFLGLVTNALKAFMASAEFQRLWARTLHNFREALRILFPDQEHYANQVRAIIFLVKLFFQLLLLTSQAAVIFAKAIRAAAGALAFLGSILKPVMGFLRPLLDLFKNLIGVLLGLKEIDVGGPFYTLIQILEALVRRSLPRLLSGLGEAAERLGRLLPSADDVLARLRPLRSLFDELAGAVRRAGSALRGLVDDLLSFVRGGEGAAERLERIGRSVSEATERLEELRGVFSGLREGAESLAGTLDEMLRTVEGLAKALENLSPKKAAEETAEMGEEAGRASGILARLRSALDDVTQALLRHVPPLRALKSALQDVGRALGDIDWMKLLSGLDEAITRFLLKLADLEPVIKRAIKVPFEIVSRLLDPTFLLRLPSRTVDVLGEVIANILSRSLRRGLQIAAKEVFTGGPGQKILLPLDIAKSIFISIFGPEDAVKQSIAQIIGDVIIEALGLALLFAAGGVAAGGLVGALVGAILGILISIATELALNPKFREAFAKLGRKIIDSIADGIGDAIETLEEAFRPLVTATVKVEREIGLAFARAFRFVADRLGDMLELVGRALRGLGDAIGRGLGGLAAKIPGVSQMADALRGMGDAVLGTAREVRAFGDTVDRTMPDVSTTVDQAVANMGLSMSQIQGSIDDTGRTWDENRPKAGSTTSEWMNKLNEFLRNIRTFASDVRSVFSGVANGISQPVREALGGIVSSVLEHGPSFVSQVSNFFLNTPMGLLTGLAQSAPGLASSWVQQAAQLVSQNAPAFASAIDRGVIANILRVPTRRAVDFVANIVNVPNVVESVRDWLSRIPGLKTVFISAATSDIGGLVTSILGQLNRLPTQKVIEIVARVGSGVEEAARSVWNAIMSGARWLLGWVPGNQRGTRNFRGGPAIVGEAGPELVFLPRGATIWPNNMTEAFLAGAAMSARVVPAASVTVYIDASGSQFIGEEDLADRVIDRLDEAIRRRLGVSALAVTRR